MPEALTHLELLSAQRLQRRGLLLRKIAAELGVSFGAVCLALYGDNQSSNAVKPAGEASDDEADVLGRAGSSDNGAGFLVPTDHLVAHWLADAAAADSEAGAVAFLEESAQATSSQQDCSPEPPSELEAPRQWQPPVGSPAPVGVTSTSSPTLIEQGDPAVEAERHELLLRFHPAQRFRLVSEDGQTLHQSLHVLTRLPNFFWRGTAEQLSAVRRRKPEWAHLKPVAVS